MDFRDSAELVWRSETLLHLILGRANDCLCTAALVCHKWRAVARRCMRRLAFPKSYIKLDQMKDAAAAFPFAISVSLADCTVADGVVEALELFPKLVAVDFTNTKNIRGDRLPEMLSIAPTLRQIKVAGIGMGDMALAELLFAASRLELLEIGGRNTTLSVDGARALARQCLRLRIVTFVNTPTSSDAVQMLVMESRCIERLRVAQMEIEELALESTSLAALEVRACPVLVRLDVSGCPGLRELVVESAKLAKSAREALKGCSLLRKLQLCAVDFSASSLRRALRTLMSLRELSVKTMPGLTEELFSEEVCPCLFMSILQCPDTLMQLQRCRYLTTMAIEDCATVSRVCPPLLPYVEQVTLKALPSLSAVRCVVLLS